MKAEDAYLTRLTLRRDDTSVSPLIAKLMPIDESESMGMHHKLLWTLFAGSLEKSEKESAFLWRHMQGESRFFVLGPKPANKTIYFEIESKPFNISFHKGQKLAFELRVNCTVDRQLDASKGRKGRQRSDIVMDAITQHEKTNGASQRADIRNHFAETALQAWMERQSSKNGFELNDISVLSYRGLRHPRYKKKEGSEGSHRRMGVADVRGVLTVKDTDLFKTKLLRGFGRSKAFGCGLMLVRPVA
jgi:CRISPR system Cascade subunit CasE